LCGGRAKKRGRETGGVQVDEEFPRKKNGGCTFPEGGGKEREGK